jgi:steroid delta-isomerase-like uncharacterized protein
LSREDSLRVVEELTAAMNRRDPHACADFYAEDCLLMDTENPQPSRGRHLVLQAYTDLFHAFPDLTNTAENVFAEGDRVAVEYAMDGTHMNEYVGVPGDASHFHVRQLTVFEVRGGKIVKDLSAWDTGPFRAKAGARS